VGFDWASQCSCVLTVSMEAVYRWSIGIFFLFKIGNADTPEICVLPVYRGIGVSAEYYTWTRQTLKYRCFGAVACQVAN
jgi:uncharacterized protein involved in tolerance to divalent cations